MMEAFSKKAVSIFTENTLWIFMTLLLFMSYLLMMSVMKDSWLNYIQVFGKLCIVYSPVLIFAFFRRTLLSSLPFKVVVALWSFCMIVWLIILPLNSESIMKFVIQEHQHSHQLEDYSTFALSFLLVTSGSVLCTELGLVFQNYFKDKLKNKIWTQAISVDKMLLVVVLLLSIFLSVVGIFRVGSGIDNITVFSGAMLAVKFIFFVFQFLIILLLYYFYYHINKHFLIPKLLKKKGVIFYGFSVAAVILIFYPLFIMFLRVLPISSELGLEFFQPDGKTFSDDGGGLAFLIMFLSVPIIISNEWFRQSNEIVNLEKEKSATELNLLKQQINPHFFFNTLNNLYALSITKDKQTPEVILQLSELMRYVIYKGKEDFVPLKEELNYIEDYVQLQQIRLHKKLDYKFDITISDKEQQIPPLLFITFVENAFKHGIEPAEGNCYLHLSLTSDQYDLVFTAVNSIEEKLDTDAGIGLKNLKRRMELRYPDKHSLESFEQHNQYSAILKLKLQ